MYTSDFLSGVQIIYNKILLIINYIKKTKRYNHVSTIIRTVRWPHNIIIPIRTTGRETAAHTFHLLDVAQFEWRRQTINRADTSPSAGIDGTRRSQQVVGRDVLCYDNIIIIIIIMYPATIYIYIII